MYAMAWIVKLIPYLEPWREVTGLILPWPLSLQQWVVFSSSWLRSLHDLAVIFAR